MIDLKKKELDFNNLEKYKTALDDGFTWGNTKYNYKEGITLQLTGEGYALTTVNFSQGTFSVLIIEKDFKIFCEKVKLFFSKNIN